MAIQDITKPMALDETLQAQNSKIDTLNARLLAIAEALGLQSVIGDTDISGIADGTLTGAVAEFDSSKLDVSAVGVAGGVAELDNTGKVPSSQLPSFVDDVLEYASVSAFPATGESGKIYVALDTNKTYRWSGTGYTEISASLALGETSSTAYRGDRGKTAYDHSQDAGRVTTATAVGLYKVGSTSEGHVSGLTPVQKADITALGIPAQDTTYDDATQSVHGLMSMADKTKLDGISTGANKVEASDTNGNIKIDGTEAQVYDDSEIQGKLSTDTATIEGNPINFSTLSAQNAESTIIDLEPIQDLHGYDKPWVGGAGKNKLPMTVVGIKALNTSGTWTGNVYTINQVAIMVFTDNDDNITGFDVHGTASATVAFVLAHGILKDVLGISSGSVTLNGCPSGGVVYSTYQITINDGTNNVTDTGNGIDFDVSTYSTTRNTDIFIRLNSGYQANHLKFYPMLRLSTETDPTFAPYENICPISGRTEIGILGTNGKESTDPDYEVSNDLTISLGQTVYGGTLDVENGVLVVDRAKVDLGTISYTATSVNGGTMFYSSYNPFPNMKNTSSIIDIANALCEFCIVGEQNDVNAGLFVGFSIGPDNARIRFFDNTVFKDLTGAEFAVAISGYYLCYELATPITINLTPHQISLLEGVNNISTTGDKITLTYRDGKVATLGDLLEVEKKIPSATAQHNYSTEEQVVGTWIDGKTLYEKTILCDLSAGNAVTPHNIANLDLVVSLRGITTKRTNGGSAIILTEQRTLNYLYSKSADLDVSMLAWYSGAFINSEAITIQSGASFANVHDKAYITVQYTKTTDV